MAHMSSTKLTLGQQEKLRATARQAIENGLRGQDYKPAIYGADAVLVEPGASFVTITKTGNLRGCIGTLEANQPLLLDVAANAGNAAFRDPRFTPINTEDWAKCDFSISVLTTPEIITIASEAELCEKLRPGTDGLIISWERHRATYLPSVWEQLPDPVDFVRELKKKAGLSADFWSSAMRCETYQSISF
jgi:AmmeMemoRadiSam system protein A